jgi:hypothetical protein
MIDLHHEISSGRTTIGEIRTTGKWGGSSTSAEDNKKVPDVYMGIP